jgi:hypothetical protein
VKNKIALMILSSLVALSLYGERTSDSYIIGAEGLLPQTSYMAAGYVLEGTLASVSGGTSKLHVNCRSKSWLHSKRTPYNRD